MITADPPTELLDNRADPDARMVLEDWERTHYGSSTTARLGIVLCITAADADAAAADVAAAAVVADADADVAAAAVAVAGVGAADAADAAAYADAYAVADADAADAAAALRSLRSLSLVLKDQDMTPGLSIVQISITNYYAITFVGWLRRIGGDEYELAPGSRVITRNNGELADWNGIDNLCFDGPGTKYTLHPPQRGEEPLHRILVRRCRRADEQVWAEHCPRPKDWDALTTVSTLARKVVTP